MTARIGVITFPGSLDDRDALRLGQDLVGYLAVDGELEALPDPDTAEVRNTQTRECARHRLPLRVQQLGLGHDVDDDGGHQTAPDVAGRGRLQSTGPGIPPGLRVDAGATTARDAIVTTSWERSLDIRESGPIALRLNRWERSHDTMAAERSAPGSCNTHQP